MAAEGVLSVENGEGFGVDGLADTEDGGVEQGGCGVGGSEEAVGAAGVRGRVEEEVVVDLLADLEGQVEEVGHGAEGVLSAVMLTTAGRYVGKLTGRRVGVVT